MYRHPSRKRALILVIACVCAIALLPGRVSVAVSGPPEYPELLSPRVEAKKLTASDAATQDYFGWAVAISGDTAVVGAEGDDDAGTGSGSAYVFERAHGRADNWGEIKKLVASDAEASDSFSRGGVAIAANTLVVGAPHDVTARGRTGSAYVFDRNLGGVNNWGERKKLTASDGASLDSVGGAVGISGDTIVVGAPWDDDAGSYTGSAYVFARNRGGTNNWGEVKKLTPSDTAAGDFFGGAVAISGDTVVVASRGSFDPGDGTGSVYVFGRNRGGTNNWGQVKKLTASDMAAEDSFAWSVAIAGDVVVAGSPYDDDGGSASGSAYVFGRNHGGAGNWGEVRKLTAADAAEWQLFGVSVGISGDNAVVGAREDDSAGHSAGSAYVFGRDQGGVGNWGEIEELTAGDAGAYDRLGGSVGISGDMVVAGAYANDDAGNQSGSAYVFGPPSGDCYVLDGFGGVHPGGAASAIASPGAPYFGFDIARDFELSGNGGYVLDGWGGVHAAGGEPPLTPGPPYFGFDVAQDIELAAGGGGYVLDGFGGIHAIGGAPVLSPATPYFGFDAARDLELGGGGYYVLDGWGGLHPGAGASAISPGPPYFGFDIAQDLELASGGGAYALDRFGGVHALGVAPVLTPPTPYFGFDIARDLELALGGGHYILDGQGGLHAGGGATVISPAPPYFGFDAARDLEIR